jgi:hypothetical protein
MQALVNGLEKSKLLSLIRSTIHFASHAHGKGRAMVHVKVTFTPYGRQDSDFQTENYKNTEIPWTHVVGLPVNKSWFRTA